MRTVASIVVITGLWAGLCMAADVYEAEATGQAAIFDDDKAQARDKALDDALRKAVESTVGTLISSETVTENYQLLSDRIFSKSEGYVQQYRIVDEGEDNGVYFVKVRAKVAVGAVENDLKSLKMLMTRKQMPRVLLMVAEQNIGSKMSFWWSTGQVISENMRIVETTMMEEMRKKGFTFVEPDALKGKIKVRMPVALLSDKQALRVAKTTDCEVVIVGKAVARSLGKTWEGSRSISATAEVSVRAINTSNGEVIAAVSVPANAFHMQAMAAGSMALRNAAKAAAEKLVEQIAAKWVEETSSAQKVRLEVSGVENNRMLKKLMSVLSSQVRGVKDVYMRSMGAGNAVLEVLLAGRTSDMAAELEAKDFGGLFKLEVIETRPNRLKLKLSK